MPFHPTFNCVPCSRPKSRHASPNQHRPTTMLHGLMDMLRSNAFSISNPTPWPIIWVKPIDLRLVSENHVLSIMMVQFSYLWANLRHVRTWLRLKKKNPLLHLCTQSNLSQSTPHNHVRQQFTCFYTMNQKSHDILNYAMHIEMSMLEEWWRNKSEYCNPNCFNISYFRNPKSFSLFHFHIYAIDYLDSCCDHFITCFLIWIS